MHLLARLSVAALLFGSVGAAGAKDIFVSPYGADANLGTDQSPVATLPRAQDLARQAAGKDPVIVHLREGTYYLAASLVFTAADSGTKAAPVIYEGDKAVISGGRKLTGLTWQPYKDNILQTPVPADVATDQLFINGEKQILARYPNYDPNAPVYHGCSADATDLARMARWADSTGGFLHAMHPARWGDYAYEMTGKDANGQVIFEGGWQNNRPKTDQ